MSKKLNKKFLVQQSEKLQNEQEKLEKQLNKFGVKADYSKTDWLTKYPKFDTGSLEEEADEVEEYDNLLSINYALENEMKKILKALQKIKKGNYGLCERCGKPIAQKRLSLYPQADYCTKCQS